MPCLSYEYILNGIFCICFTKIHKGTVFGFSRWECMKIIVLFPACLQVLWCFISNFLRCTSCLSILLFSLCECRSQVHSRFSYGKPNTAKERRMRGLCSLTGFLQLSFGICVKKRSKTKHLVVLNTCIWKLLRTI